jgi:hypothetical protein
VIDSKPCKFRVRIPKGESVKRIYQISPVEAAARAVTDTSYVRSGYEEYIAFPLSPQVYSIVVIEFSDSPESGPQPSDPDIDSRIEEALNNIVQEQGYSLAQEFRGLLSGGDSDDLIWQLTTSSDLLFLLSFAGSALRLTVFGPDGKVAAEMESGLPPLTIPISAAQPGTWKIRITGTVVPWDDYPYALGIGIKEPERPIVTDLHNFPNPAVSQVGVSGEITHIVYELNVKSRIAIDIFNGAGEMVCSLENPPGEEGVNAVAWDGRTPDGKEVSNGVYIYRLVATAGNRQVSKTAKLVILR